MVQNPHFSQMRISEAWLRTFYTISAQVNNVKSNLHIWNLSFSETIPMYTHYYQLLSDLWQGCSNRSDIVMITTQLDCNNIVISWLYLVENCVFEIQKTIFHFAHQHQFTLSILTKWNLRKEGWGGGGRSQSIQYCYNYCMMCIT
jgi:hypothetical protein